MCLAWITSLYVTVSRPSRIATTRPSFTKSLMLAPVAYGVITCNTYEQAVQRSSAGSGNKGWEAALAAIEMANLWRVLRTEES